MGHAAVTRPANERARVRGGPLPGDAAPRSASASRPDAALASDGRGAGGHRRRSGRSTGTETAFDFAAADDRQGLAFRISTRDREKPLVFQGPNGFSRKGDDRRRGEPLLQLHPPRDRRASSRSTASASAFAGELDGQGDQLARSSARPGGLGLVQPPARRRARAHALSSCAPDDGSDRLRERDPRLGRTARPATWTHGRVRGRGPWTRGRAPRRAPATRRAGASRWRARRSSWTSRRFSRTRRTAAGLPGGVYYWEGAVAVPARAAVSAGRGFVELTGYGEGNRPPI